MSSKTPRIGIALGSGIARGWAHIGILRALESRGIVPDIVCGTSVGAFVGGAYAAGRLDALETWARDLKKFSLSRLFDVQFAHGGLIAGRKMMQIFEEELPEIRIEDLPLRFACVSTDLDTGHEVWIQDGPLIEAVRASSAVPGILPPVRFDGRRLIDGALVNPIPVSVCRALGAHIVIAVDLNTDVFEAGWQRTTTEIGDTDEKAIVGRIKSLPGADFIRHLFRHQNHEPSVLGVMARSLDIIQNRTSRIRLASDPPDVKLTPQLGGIGMLQFDRAAEVIAAGTAAVEEAEAALNELLVH
ncbi:patatin [Telmatospirillum siberiense]|uniref:Patatin n=2 Tax=Telmatospirillum siberiense TaxID=382514 RepID=A0A2N3PRZ7_9PROT|nr:patatin [Telmatospirillum siberiense]